MFQYDTAYTERYMGLPSQQGNWRGYLQASLVAAANNIGDGQLLLLHGSQDDNVHLGHSLRLSKELVRHNILFRHQVSSLSL